MTDSVVGYAVCTEHKPRYFAGMMRGEPVLSTKAEDCTCDCGECDKAECCCKMCIDTDGKDGFEWDGGTE